MDCLKCKASLKAIMARPRPKALLDALEQTGIKTLENAPEASRNRKQHEHEDFRKGGGGSGGSSSSMGSTLNIKCLNCAEEGIAMKARAYMEAPPMSVVLCANRLQDRREMEEALVHELVHVYDVRTGVNWSRKSLVTHPSTHPTMYPQHQTNSTPWSRWT